MTRSVLSAESRVRRGLIFGLIRLRASVFGSIRNRLVTKEGGFIALNPHVGNCWLLRLDEQVATALYHLLGEWLGYEPVDD